MLLQSLNGWARSSARRVLEAVGLRKPPLLTGHSHFFTLSPETPRAIEKALVRVHRLGLAGDYYEFGLFHGYTFCYAQRIAQSLKLQDMVFFGFDSFRGLPRPEGVDSLTADFKEADYACDLQRVRRNLQEHGVDWGRTHLIEGYYKESLTPELKQLLRLRPVSLALIDCDLYGSTVHVLDFLASLLQDESILLFDDWNCFNKSDEMGERRAFREFLARYPGWRAVPLLDFGWHGQGFVMKRNIQ